MSVNWKNWKRTGAKMGGAVLGGYLSGDYAGAVSAGLTEAANGGFDNSRGYNFLHDTAAPTAVGYIAGQSGAGKGFNRGIDAAISSNAANPTISLGARLAALGKGGYDGAYTGFTDADTFNSGHNSIDALLGSDMKSRLARGALGAGIASMTAPKMPAPVVSTKAQLDAVSMPDIRRSNADRIAAINANLASKGGVSSSDLYNRQLTINDGQRVQARQSAANQLSANASINAAQEAAYLAEVRRQRDIMSGAMTGFNLGQPVK